MSHCRQLPAWRSVLAVVAHPDDESFGLGAVLARLAPASRVFVLCFTHGEASSLHGVAGDLRRVRESELRAAAEELGLDRVVLLDHADGELAAVSAETLAAEVVDAAAAAAADGLVVFDSTGVTGHPDHRAATAGACHAARRLGLPVLTWMIPDDVATALNSELGTTFVGRPRSAVDIAITVDRRRQRAAISRHASQAMPTSALWRRLELLRNTEYLRWIYDPRRADHIAVVREREAAAPAALEAASGT